MRSSITRTVGKSGHPVTPDGRYFVVRGRLWRMSNPALSEKTRGELVRELMSARRAVKASDDPESERTARDRVNAAKIALGERGPAWWDDNAPDYNQRKVADTPYASWYNGLSNEA